MLRAVENDFIPTINKKMYIVSHFVARASYLIGMIKLRPKMHEILSSAKY